ncbi:L-fuconolactonase [Paraburkholderia sp. BL6665CI2N2]|uniref:amidohydrolase family protein n=1 Tax=Paraburkholderia sp. BL6665CI2N2 TaxID=1938806 RepID=UPI0010ED826D|nr:amidohydrolase family protein [Paraburkholderia sp. BL6665CI2N2]TDY23023.1 L-fuconolactonase [Paraburkholderia sp. BL6665CI2N2]
MSLRIDAHHHFWHLAARVGHWPPASLGAIYRDFGPADFEPLLERCGIGGTVLVQSLPDSDDTSFLLELAERHSFIRGVVGWVDLKAPDAPQQIDALARHPKLKALRPMLQDLPDDNWIDDPVLRPAITAMLANDLAFDALVVPRQLPGLVAFAKRYPGLRIVIDHAAKPLIATGQLEPWRTDMADLARLENVHCKLSGLWTEAPPDIGVAAFEPYVETLFRLFGPRRLLWGSDWPVQRLATHFGDYAGWLAACDDYCDRYASDEDKGAVFGGNAYRFYRLEE